MYIYLNYPRVFTDKSYLKCIEVSKSLKTKGLELKNLL